LSGGLFPLARHLVAFVMPPNAGAQPRGPLPDVSCFPFGCAARVGCSGLLAGWLIPKLLCG
jgi:hypothetical protein